MKLGILWAGIWQGHIGNRLSAPRCLELSWEASKAGGMWWQEGHHCRFIHSCVWLQGWKVSVSSAADWTTYTWPRCVAWFPHTRVASGHFTWWLRVPSMSVSSNKVDASVPLLAQPQILWIPSKWQDGRSVTSIAWLLGGRSIKVPCRRTNMWKRRYRCGHLRKRQPAQPAFRLQFTSLPHKKYPPYSPEPLSLIPWGISFRSRILSSDSKPGQMRLLRCSSLRGFPITWRSVS